MNKLSMPKQPVEYIIKYDKDIDSNLQYKLTITYCVFCGNLVRDIESRQRKIVNCNGEKIERMESKLHNKIVQTYNRLYKELRQIGANQKTIEAEIAKRMR